MKSRIHARIGTLRQLEILLAAHEEGGIKGASERLHLTQPTVSMQLKKLSEAIDTPIFEKAGRQRLTTDAGKALISTAREVLSSFERLEETLSDLRGLRAGTLKIAAVTTSQYFIPHLLGPFCQQYPGVDVRFHVGNRQQIIQRLADGLDDLYVFSHPPVDEDIESSEFLPNPLVAIAPEGHPLTQQSQISLTDLTDEGLLMREPGSGTRHAIEQHLAHHQIRLQPRMTIESNEAIKHGVMSGLGVAIISAHALSFGGRSGLSELSVEGLPIDSRWFMVTHRSRRLSPIAQSFRQYLEGEGKAMMMEELAIS